MRRRLRLAAMVSVGLLLLAAVVILSLYGASQRVPEFYRLALEDSDPVRQREVSNELLRQASALMSDSQKEGRWEAMFTAEQLNGWLAVDLAENHPEALPNEFSDPRVTIDGDEMTLGCRFRRGRMATVLTLTIEPYVIEPNVLAIRICRVRAGWLPMPLSDLLEQITMAATEANLRLQWRQMDGDPVAQVTLPPSLNEAGTEVRIETLRLDDGRLYVAGTTSKSEKNISPKAGR